MTATPKAQDAIPVLDLRAQYAGIREEIRSALDEVLSSQQFILGPQLAALEQEVARYCGRRFGIGVGSGTDALMLALQACGVEPADEVIVPTFSFIATAGAVTALGARPVFADIQPDTCNLDPTRIESKITPRTRALIPVHLYGLPAEMDPILAIAARHGLKVIEDNAQAIGATYRGRKTGSFGELGCISFYPSKNLGAYGDAGMIVADSEELAARLRSLRDHGQSGKYVSAEPGWNSRLDEVQAAVLRVKLRHLDHWQAARQAHAARYTELLGGVPGVATPLVPSGSDHVYHQYTIRIPGQAAASGVATDRGIPHNDAVVGAGPRPRPERATANVGVGFSPPSRDRVQQFLAARGIASNVYYPVPLHLQPAYTALGYQRGDLPVAERAADEVLSLPMYPELTPEQIERVAAAIASTLRE